jgi:DNA replication and repair protein RecF
MKIKSISLSDFRNIEKEKIEFSDGVNLIYGHNAQGKTNALEAIYYFARGRSFRTSRDLDLIQKGKEKFHIEIFFEDKERERTLSCTIGKKERIRKKNGIKIEKISEMIGLFHAVLFCPEHLSLVKGAPEERRSFLNIAISQYDKTYINIYYSYKKALENRNALLKLMQKGFFVDEREFNSWSEALAEYSSFIYLKRKQRKRSNLKAPKSLFFFLSRFLLWQTASPLKAT